MSSSDRRFVLHLGYPKTGTTTLQRGLFSQHPEIAYLGRPFDDALLDLEHTILTADEATFEARRAELVQRLVDRIEATKEPAIVFSHEGFLRATRHGGHDLARTLPRIASIFGEATEGRTALTVLVCLRNPIDYLVSHFVQFMRGEQADLDAHVRAAIGGEDSLYFRSLRFDETLDRLRGLFGEGLVVRLFEELKAGSTDYARSICETIGIDADYGAGLLEGQHRKQKQKSEEGYWVEQRSGPVYRVGAILTGIGLRELGRSIKRRAVHHVALRPELRAELADHFRPMNRRLLERFDLPVSRYGYDV